jgi:hypothetical protein
MILFRYFCFFLVLTGSSLRLLAEKADYQPPVVKSDLSTIMPVALRYLRMVDPAVEVLAQVDAEGKVVDLVSLNASHYGLLERAERSVRKGKYKPATLDGKPVSSSIRILVPFYDPDRGLGQVVVQSGLEHISATVDSMKEPDYVYGVTSSSDLDSPVQIVSRGKVFVPTDEEGNRIEGECKVEFFIDRNGKVCAPRVLDSDDILISQAATMSIQQTVFTPPMVNEKPTVVKVRMPFNYTAGSE